MKHSSQIQILPLTVLFFFNKLLSLSLATNFIKSSERTLIIGGLTFISSTMNISFYNSASKLILATGLKFSVTDFKTLSKKICWKPKIKNFLLVLNHTVEKIFLKTAVWISWETLEGCLLNFYIVIFYHLKSHEDSCIHFIIWLNCRTHSVIGW